MNWRGGLRLLAIVLNILFAGWLFLTAAIWGPNDYVGGAVSTIPPPVAIVALCALRADGSNKRL